MKKILFSVLSIVAISPALYSAPLPLVELASKNGITLFTVDPKINLSEIKLDDLGFAEKKQNLDYIDLALEARELARVPGPKENSYRVCQIRFVREEEIPMVQRADLAQASGWVKAVITTKYPSAEGILRNIRSLTSREDRIFAPNNKTLIIASRVPRIVSLLPVIDMLDTAETAKAHHETRRMQMNKPRPEASKIQDSNSGPGEKD